MDVEVQKVIWWRLPGSVEASCVASRAALQALGAGAPLSWRLSVLTPVQAMQAELGSKEGRLSVRHMAMLARPLLQQHRLRGWVLEGFPRNLAGEQSRSPPHHLKIL